MPAKDALPAELDELHADLTRSAPDRPDSPADGSSDWVTDIEKIGMALHAELSEAAEDAEDIVSAHPLAAVGAAMLLGIVIGRMMGRVR